MRSFALPLALVLVPALLPAQAPPAGPAVRQEAIDIFSGTAGRCLALAKAIPEDKYSWRPMEGVRSFGEVFAHMAGSTLLFMSYAGMKTPPGPAHDLAAVYMKRGFEMPEIFAVEAAIKDKAKTLAIMEDSFKQARDWVAAMKDSDMDKPVEFFGRTISTRRLLIGMGDHLSEHLGQAIAYSRVNHIVPPWSQKSN